MITKLQKPTLKFDILLIVSITLSGLLLRFFLADYDTFGSDALIYYEYAATMAFQGHYPDTAIELHNIGWVLFLVPIFKIIGPYQSTLFFAQHTTSIIISSLTIPVSYIFARRFIKSSASILVPILFAVDFRMVQNAGFGITEPLFLSLCLAAYSTKNKILMFLFAGLACLVRFEGIMLIPVLFLINRRKAILPYCLIPIAILVILFLVNNSIGHSDQIVAKVNHEIGFTVSPSIYVTPNFDYWYKGFTNSLKYMVWAAFPTFVLSVYGMWKHKWLIIPIAILAVSGVWAYLDAYDTRYFFPMYPFLGIASAFGFERLLRHVNKFVGVR